MSHGFPTLTGQKVPDMTKICHGKHRVRNPPPAENGVWVADGNNGFEMRESAYRETNIVPDIKTLGWAKGRKRISIF